MKKILLVFAILFIGLTSQADEVFVSSVSLDNLWQKLGVKEQSVNNETGKVEYNPAAEVEQQVKIELFKDPKYQELYKLQVKLDSETDRIDTEIELLDQEMKEFSKTQQRHFRRRSRKPRTSKTRL